MHLLLTYSIQDCTPDKPLHSKKPQILNFLVKPMLPGEAFTTKSHALRCGVKDVSKHFIELETRGTASASQHNKHFLHWKWIAEQSKLIKNKTRLHKGLLQYVFFAIEKLHQVKTFIVHFEKETGFVRGCVSSPSAFQTLRHAWLWFIIRCVGLHAAPWCLAGCNVMHLNQKPKG